MLKISVVTISFNQSKYLERCIQSVLDQRYANLEYIIVDAGSTDGSREIIEKYKDSFSHIVLEPDNGPADGLNKGFNLATGDIYYFINSDDMLCLDSFKLVSSYFEKNSKLDVVYGNGYKIDENDLIFKKVISNNYFSLNHYAYNCFTFIQPSMFFTKASFIKVRGFNELNKIAWDGELFVDFGLKQFNIQYINEYLSKFRWYDDSISGSGNFTKQLDEFHNRIFERIKTRNWKKYDVFVRFLILIFKYIKQPSKILNYISNRIYLLNNKS